MSILGRFFKKKVAVQQEPNYVVDKTIPESEKIYYQDDSYYVKRFAPGSPFEKEIIPFEERKKKAIPSGNGLYVPEILMLHFCKNFPNPTRGYPGYWWFKYGVRNVGALLISLEQRGFIKLGEKGKYELTDLGRFELQDNEYVLYMHQHQKYTDFTAWELNIMLGTGDKSQYMTLVNQRESEYNDFNKKKNEEFYDSLKKNDYDSYIAFVEQDKQLAAIKNAEEIYKENKDLNALIAFWEGIWNGGGLLFRGVRWTFRLPDLYIRTKQYDKALEIIDMIDKQQQYEEKIAAYRAKIADKMKTPATGSHR